MTNKWFRRFMSAFLALALNPIDTRAFATRALATAPESVGINDMQGKATPGLGALGRGIAGTLGGLLGALGEAAVEEGTEHAGEAVEGAGETVGEAVEGAGETIGEAAEHVGEAAKGAEEAIKGAVEGGATAAEEGTTAAEGAAEQGAATAEERAPPLRRRPSRRPPRRLRSRPHASSSRGSTRQRTRLSTALTLTRSTILWKTRSIRMDTLGKSCSMDKSLHGNRLNLS